MAIIAEVKNIVYIRTVYNGFDLNSFQNQIYRKVHEYLCIIFVFMYFKILIVLQIHNTCTT